MGKLQSKNTDFIFKNSECAAETVKEPQTTSGMKSETNQPQPGDLTHRSGRHQVGHVDFLLEDTPEKEKQMFTSSFSCQLGLVIPKQTPWNLHG